jgi:anti-anti-sigma factor
VILARIGCHQDLLWGFFYEEAGNRTCTIEVWAHSNGEFLMNMIESTIGEVPLIVVDGELDHSSKQVVLDAVSGIFSGPYPPQNLLFDLTDCTFIDSGGLSVLLAALGQLPAGGWLGLIGVATGANRVLTYTGFLDTDNVRFFSSPSDAAASLAREKKLLQMQEHERPK